MKKKLHVIAIEYPVVTILLVTVMMLVLWRLCEGYKVDKYYEVTGTICYDELTDTYIANVSVPIEYYDGIMKNQTIIWYTDLESAVYAASLCEILTADDQCKVILKLDKEEYEKEKAEIINFKLSYKKESVLSRLLSN